MRGPLRAVLTEMTRGARSLDAVAESTGLSQDVVAAAVDHLVRLGRVSANDLAGSGCATSGACGGCALRSGCGVKAGSGLVAFTVR